MTRQQFHTTAQFYLAILIAFCLPIARLVPVFISLMLLNWLIEGDFKNKFNSIVKNKFALLFIAFYVLHLVGLLYTQNMQSGLFDVQVKLSLLLFPIILSSRPFDENKIRKLFFALIIGCFTAFLIMLSRALYIYVDLGERSFYYEAFASFLIHPSYISMYVNVTLAWLLINQLDQSKRFSRSVSCSLLIVFTLFIILLSSKMGLITMIVMYTVFLIYHVISQKKYLFGISGVFAIVISIYIVMSFIPELSGRINRAISAVTNSNTDQSEAESTAVRMLIWKASNRVISENLILGTGTGDAKNELMKEYEKRGMTGAYEHKLNAHNEFYQVFLSLGVIGFILLLLNLLFPLFKGFKMTDTIYVLFLLIISLNFLTESMLETEAGVMFYAFFNSLLCFSHQKLTTNN